MKNQNLMKKIYYYFLAIVVVLIITSNGNAMGAEPIMITESQDMSEIIFDGKWTHMTEWKRSSLNTLSYDDGTRIQLRSAHQDDFIYFFVDVVTDIQPEKGTDRTIICLDTNNDKSSIANADDYCFVVTLDRKSSFVFQGGSPLRFNSNFKTISTPEGFVGIGNVSDQNDRYNKIPHPSYEFKIPTDFVGRSNNYGIYVGVFDSYSNKMYSWPQDISIDRPFQIPSPSRWGDLVSPDNSLPEFELPVFSLIPAFALFFVFITKIRNTKLLHTGINGEVTTGS